MSPETPEPIMVDLYREQFFACATADKGPGDALVGMLEVLKNVCVLPESREEVADLFEDWGSNFSFNTESHQAGSTLVDPQPLDKAEVFGQRIALICEISCFFALDLRSSLGHKERVDFLIGAKRELTALLGGPGAAHAEKSAKQEVLKDALPYLQTYLDQSVLKQRSDRDNPAAVAFALHKMFIYNDLLGILRGAGVIGRMQWFVNRLT